MFRQTTSTIARLWPNRLHVISSPRPRAILVRGDHRLVVCLVVRLVGSGKDFMKALQREALTVVLLAPPEPANDTNSIPDLPTKWQRVTVNRNTLTCALVVKGTIPGHKV